MERLPVNTRLDSKRAKQDQWDLRGLSQLLQRPLPLNLPRWLNLSKLQSKHMSLKGCFEGQHVLNLSGESITKSVSSILPGSPIICRLILILLGTGLVAAQRHLSTF